MSKQQVIDSIPSGWEVKGRALYDKNNLYRARIDPPDNVTNYDHIHLYDYFNKKNNKLNILLDENFNRVPYNSPDGHIKIMP